MKVSEAIIMNKFCRNIATPGYVLSGLNVSTLAAKKEIGRYYLVGLHMVIFILGVHALHNRIFRNISIK